MLNSGVTRFSQASIRRGDNAGLRPLILFQKLAGKPVRRTVVDDDNFEIGEGLSENAFDRLVERRPLVETRNDYRYHGLRHGHTCCK